MGNLTAHEIVAFCNLNPRTIHIEWDGVNHYAALIRSSEPLVRISFAGVTNALLPERVTLLLFIVSCEIVWKPEPFRAATHE